MGTRWWVVVGAVLPLLLGATLGSSTTTAGAGTWAAPVPAPAFLALSVGLAVSHLLVALAYTAVAGTSTAAALLAARTGAAGSVALAACELWSGALARTALDAPVLDLLQAAYAVASLVVLVGTLWLAAVLRRSRSRLAAPVLLNGLVLLVAIPLRFLAGDLVGIAALTAWSLTYAWWGLRLPRSASTSARAEAPVSS